MKKKLMKFLTALIACSMAIIQCQWVMTGVTPVLADEFSQQYTYTGGGTV